MTSFEAYIDYLALKAHFTRDYDYVKFGGKIKTSHSAFENRKDRYQFKKLSEKTDPHGILVANLFEDPNRWIGDILKEDGTKTYLDYLNRKQGMSYYFKQEVMEHLIDDSPGYFNEQLISKDGNHPPLLKKYLQKKISPETLLILNDIVRFIDHWDRAITEDIIWPTTKHKLRKYFRLMSFDRDKYCTILKEIVQDNT